jgi:hypothetical protein
MVPIAVADAFDRGSCWRSMQQEVFYLKIDPLWQEVCKGPRSSHLTINLFSNPSTIFPDSFLSLPSFCHQNTLVNH